MLAPIVISALLAQAAPPPTTPPAQQAAPVVESAQVTPWPPAGVARLKTSGVQAPRLIKDVKPQYTGDAMRAKIQGVVKMEAVVETDGTVGEVRVTQSLDQELGLDDEAVKAVKKWRFEPGRKDGVVVPVLVEILMTFTRR
jgi:TonB family protein